MIIREEVEIKNKKFIKTYSDDKTMWVKKVGTDEIYDYAIDPIEFKDERQYEEVKGELLN